MVVVTSHQLIAESLNQSAARDSNLLAIPVTLDKESKEVGGLIRGVLTEPDLHAIDRA